MLYKQTLVFQTYGHGFQADILFKALYIQTTHQSAHCYFSELCFPFLSVLDSFICLASTFACPYVGIVSSGDYL